MQASTSFTHESHSTQMTDTRLPTTHDIPDSDRPRQRRADGDATRADIIEVAGTLFAKQGYFGTTSKAICKQAGVNVAAINYHFGSRDGLYLAVLKEVHHRFMSIEFLQALADSSLPAPEKLQLFFRELVQHIMTGDSWPMRVWAREMLTPTAMLDRIIREETLPKFKFLTDITHDITGIDASDERMPQLALSTIAPCLVMLIMDRRTSTPLHPVLQQSPIALADALCQFALAGLQQAAH
ncbi:TetR/AcrR family transcriptional regulator [Zymobacter sp. IVIA_12111.31 C1]|uniref:TetR/AcrR family transcriptional regulator n=1 Tax=Zymobacter sp. IVIA_12111.31 C1 TaxID=3394854 RepID=UPI0039C15518